MFYLCFQSPWLITYNLKYIIKSQTNKMSSAHQLSSFQQKFLPQIDKIFDNSISLHSGDKICRRCQKQFNKNDFDKHQKNCKRQKMSSGQRETRSLTLNSHSSEKLSLSFMENFKNNNDQDMIVQSIMTAVVDFVRTSVMIFVNKNSFLSHKVLLDIMMHKCLDFNNILSGVLKDEELSIIKKDALIGPIIFQLNDIFNADLIEERIKKFPKNKQQKIRNRLNKFMKEKGLPEIYSKGKLIFLTQKSTLPLMFSEFRRLIISMIRTKQRNYVHLALDLLIIYHSQQRMPGSIDIVEDLISKLLESDKIQTKIKATIKTGNQETLTINQQLKEMLVQFGWKKFFNKRCLERLSQYFNFSLICLRKGCYSEIYLHSKRILIHELTFHKVEESVNYYLKSVLKSELISFHQKLDLLNQNYYETKIEKVIPQAIKLLPGDQSFCQLSQFSYLSQKKLMIENDNNQMEPEQNQAMEEQIQINNNIQNEQSNSQNQKEDANFIQIMDMEYQIRNGKFISSIFENFSKKNANCKTCLQGVNCSKICIFCCSTYHQKCLPQFCKCMKFAKPIKQVMIRQKPLSSKLKIEMPDQYFSNEKYLIQLRKLIHLRGFYFCTAAISTPNTPSICDLTVEEVKLPKYDIYETGGYCPPIFFAQSGEENTFGTGIGLFAAQQIPLGTFLGQYGGTIVSQDELILLKRKDMSMKFFQKEGVQYYVGADHHCSYVQLVNGSSSTNINCEIVTVTVNGKLKILLYTNKVIHAGDELLYDYGKGFQTQFTQPLKVNIEGFNQNIQAQLINQSSLNQNPLATQNKSNKIPVQNLGQNAKKKKQSQGNKTEAIQKINLQRCKNSCYADTAFVLIKMFSKYIPKNSTSSLTNQLLSNKKIQVGKIVGEFEAQRKEMERNIQQDFDEFLTFLKKKLGIDWPFPTIVLNQQFYCQACRQEVNKYLYQQQFRPHRLELNCTQQYTVEGRCEVCKITQVIRVKRKIISSPPVLIFNFGSTLLDGTKRTNIVELNAIENQKYTYHPKLVVYHHGQSANQGHFVTHDINSGLVFDSGSCRPFDPQIDFHTCLVICERENLHGQDEQVERQLRQCGVFLEKNKKIIMRNNFDKYFNIASIVKIITFLTCQKLRLQFSLKLTDRFVIPKCSHLFGTNANLHEGQNISISELYNYMLVMSACDAAYTLSDGFGSLLKTGDRQKIKSEDLFIDQMKDVCFNLRMFDTIIEDPCGLKKNISCVSDLLILIEQAVKSPDFLQITKAAVYQGYQNTNVFYEKIRGKTGTHREGACFLGKNENCTVVMLNVKSHQTIQYFVGLFLSQ